MKYDTRNEENNESFPEYRASRSTYICYLVTRVLVAALIFLTLLFVCVSFGAPLARVTLKTVNSYYNTYFDVYMWRLKGQNAADAHLGSTVVNFGGRSTAWINSGGRVCSIVTLIVSLASLVVSLMFIFYLHKHERERQDDDEERERCVQEDRRERERIQLEVQDRQQDSSQPSPQQQDGPRSTAGASDNNNNTNTLRSQQATREFRSSMKPASYYIARENKRRQTNFVLGVTLFSLLLLTFVFTLASMAACAAFVNTSKLGDDLEDIFDDLNIDLDDDDIEFTSEKVIKAGIVLLIVAFIFALIAVVLTALPPLAGWSICGPHTLKDPENTSDVRGRSGVEMQPYSTTPGYPSGASQGLPPSSQLMPPSYPQSQPPSYPLYQPQPYLSYPQEPQRAVRGIPVALPGPPVETLEIEGEQAPRNSTNCAATRTCGTDYVQNFFPGAPPSGSGGGGGGGAGARGCSP